MPELEIRPPLATRVWTVGFFAVWFSMLGYFTISDPNPVTPLMAVFGAAIAYRNLRLAVIAHPGGLEVRNGLRSRTIPWRDIEDFRVGNPSPGMPFGKAIHALVRDGQLVRLEATMRLAVTAGGKSKVQSWADDLRSRLSSR